MTYDEVVAAFEGKFTHVSRSGIATRTSRDERDSEYLPIYAAQKQQSAGRAPSPIESVDVEAAYDKWLEVALDFIPDGAVTLYWRVMPEVELGPGGGPFIFARASFSNKAPNV